ncbi:hypothetical protein TEHIT2_22540 [Tetragenococcus halophilus]|nr:hypothetical protein TEHIT2_22540 [Tetragenococcus halophilus]
MITLNSFNEELPKLYQLKQPGFSTKGNSRGIGLNSLDDMIAREQNVLLDTQVIQDGFQQMLTVTVEGE